MKIKLIYYPSIPSYLLAFKVIILHLIISGRLIHYTIFLSLLWNYSREETLSACHESHTCLHLSIYYQSICIYQFNFCCPEPTKLKLIKIFSFLFQFVSPRLRPHGVNKTGCNLIVFHFHICGKLHLFNCPKNPTWRPEISGLNL